MVHEKIFEYFLNGAVCQYDISEETHPEPSISKLKSAYLTKPELSGDNGGWRQPIGAIYDQNNCLVWESRLRLNQELPENAVRDSDARYLEGKYIYLGYYNEVYGHFILETLARLWILDEIDCVDREFIFHSMHGNTSLNKGYIKEIFGTFGIDLKKVHILNEDAVVEDLLVPSSLSYIGNSQHKRIKSIYKKFNGSASVIEDSSRVYVSRALVKAGNHRFINELSIEKIFESYGFKIIRPEECSFEEQVAYYRNASVLAGPLSSALHNSVFCPDGAKIIALNGRWNRQRPDADKQHVALDKRSVQDFMCLNYDQSVYYVEAQKAFTIDGHALGRMPYWIDENHLSQVLGVILQEEARYTVVEKQSLQEHLIKSMIEYSTAKSLNSLLSYLNEQDGDFDNISQGTFSANCSNQETPIVLDVLPNRQSSYDSTVEAVRDKINKALS